MKRRMTKIFAGSMAIMLMTSGIPEGFLQKTETFQKEHTAYAAVTGYISSYNDLVEATATGGIYQLSNSIVLTDTVTIPKGVDLTLLQEPGKDNKITSVKYNDHLLYVKEGASLTLGSKDTDEIILDGSNLNEGLNLLTVEGTLTIENADISCKNGCGVNVRKGGKLKMKDGYIHDCGYYGILINGEGVVEGGTITDCNYAGVVAGTTNTGCKITGGVISNSSYYGIKCAGTCTMTGGLVTGCDTGVYTTGSSAAFTMNGGIVSNSKTYALDPDAGSIYLTGGSIQNDRCTTRTGSSFYIGGRPYFDDNSFIIVREGAPLVQMGNLSAPATNPYAKINIYGLTTVQPLIIPLAEEISLLDSVALYQTFDRDFSLSVKDNQIYMEGTKEIDSKIFPTVRPGASDATEGPFTSIDVQTVAPIETFAPEQPSVSPAETTPVLGSEMPTGTQQPTIQTPGAENTKVPTATQSAYEQFSSTKPEITKISAKGLNFQLQWKFSGVASADEYAVYCSSDQKKYDLIKTVDGKSNTTSVSVSKAYTGKKIYFYVVARAKDAASGNMYQSGKSYVASKYLIDKVEGTTGSYHTSTQKLVVKWKKVSNCTGYSVYIKAHCNGKTMTKRCATVSKKKNSVTISTGKIKRMFASNGKPIRIKKYSVRAFYKSGKKTAYSPS